MIHLTTGPWAFGTVLWLEGERVWCFGLENAAKAGLRAEQAILVTPWMTGMLRDTQGFIS